MTEIKPFEQIGNFTTFPNVILDEIMPLCTSNEWKILCYAIRQTIGFHREQKGISINEFLRSTGIKSKPTVVKAVHGCLPVSEDHPSGKGFLIRVPYKSQQFKYKLNKQFKIETGSKNKPVTSSKIEPVFSTTGSKNDTVYSSVKKDIKKSINKEKNITQYRKISIAFVNETKIPELTGGAQSWNESIGEMVKAGVEVEDVKKSIEILRERNYSIVRPRSIVNTAISEMSKRKSRNGSKPTKPHVKRIVKIVLPDGSIGEEEV